MNNSPNAPSGAFTLTATIEVPAGVSLNPALTAENIERICQRALKSAGYWLAHKNDGVKITVTVPSTDV